MVVKRFESVTTLKSSLVIPDSYSERAAVIEMSNAMEGFLTVDNTEHKVALVDINNNSGSLPKDNNFTIIQAGCVVFPESRCKEDKVVSYVKEAYGEKCRMNITMSCLDGCRDFGVDKPIVHINLDEEYARANPEHMVAYQRSFYGYEKIGRKGYSWYYPGFHLMRYKQNNFFNAGYHIKGCVNLNFSTNHEYYIHNGKIYTSFEKGQVLMAYFAPHTDKNELYMYPNIVNVRKAIIAYATKEMALKEYENNKTRDNRTFWIDMNQYYDRVSTEAISDLRSVSPEEWYISFKNVVARVIPNWGYWSNYARYVPDQYRSNYNML